MILKRTKLVVYQLPIGWWSPDIDVVGMEWTAIDAQVLAKYFSQDKSMQDMFSRFLRSGFLGIVWHRGQDWTSYAWMSLPETFGPPHLPRGVQRLPVYWIFYCGTKREYQGRGLYKASLSLLGRWARERDPEAEVYIDTAPDNVPSRRAIETVGFSPKGTITTWTLRLPKLGLIIGGQWDQNAPHPKERQK